jgi:hypothetical protein
LSPSLGRSGGGKSSLVLAGLVAALRERAKLGASKQLTATLADFQPLV